MATVRTLCIAGGGGGGQAGGGGAGGFIDENITIDNYRTYNIKVGEKGIGSISSYGTNGGDSTIKKDTTTIQEYSFNITSSYDSVSTETIDVSDFSNEDIIWLKLQVSGTDSRDYDGLTIFSIDGTDLIVSDSSSRGELMNGTYYFDVTSLVSGKSNVDISNYGRDITPSITAIFQTGYMARSIGGGGGANAGEYQYGRPGGSGGGGSGDGTHPAWGGSGVPGQGSKGGDGDEGDSSGPGSPPYGGGDGAGGGAGGAGQSGLDSDQPTSGGPGLASDITGSSVTYASGGQGTLSGATGGQNTGDGGGTYKDGGSGVVILRYNPDDFNHKFEGGDNVYYVPTFTSIQQTYTATGSNVNDNHGDWDVSSIKDAESVELTVNANAGDFNQGDEELTIFFNGQSLGTHTESTWAGLEIDVSSYILGNNTVAVSSDTESESLGGDFTLTLTALYRSGEIIQEFTSDGVLEPVLSAQGFMSL